MMEAQSPARTAPADMAEAQPSVLPPTTHVFVLSPVRAAASAVTRPILSPERTTRGNFESSMPRRSMVSGQNRPSTS